MFLCRTGKKIQKRADNGGIMLDGTFILELVTTGVDAIGITGPARFTIADSVVMSASGEPIDWETAQIAKATISGVLTIPTDITEDNFDPTMNTEVRIGGEVDLDVSIDGVEQEVEKAIANGAIVMSGDELKLAKEKAGKDGHISVIGELSDIKMVSKSRDE